jgi:hypothetical protein
MDRGERYRKVNDAVQRGLALCRHSVAPLVSLSRFLDDLHADPTWREAEVMLVEAAIRHILARVVRTNSEGAAR